MKTKTYIYYLLILSLLIPSCSSSRKIIQGTETKTVVCEPGKQGGTMTLGLNSGLTSFNPFVDSTIDTFDVTHQLFATVLDYDFDKNKVEDTGLASLVNTESDGKSYLIKIRKCFFSDGLAITANDIAYSYQLCLNQELNSSLGDLLRIEGQEPQITIVDPQTITIKFPVVLPFDIVQLFLARIPVVSKASFESLVKSSSIKEVYGLETPPEKIICSGAFKVKSNTPNELILEANKNYWKVDSVGTLLPYVSEVKYVTNIEPKLQSEKLAKGELDIVNQLTSDQLQKLSSNAGFSITNKGTSLRTWALVPNTRIDTSKVDPNKAKHFLVTDFRKALSHAINRNNLVKEVASGNAKAAYNVISSGNQIWFNAAAPNYIYDPSISKTKLLSSRYKYNGTQLVDETDRPVRFTVLHPKFTEATTLANLIVNDFKAIGIDAKIEVQDYKQYWKTLNRGAFDLALVEISPEFIDPIFIQPYVIGKKLWTTEGSITNFDTRKSVWYTNVTKNFSEAIKSKSAAERKAKYNEIQKIWGEQCPIIYLISTNTLIGAKSSIGNLHPSNSNLSATWNLEELYLK